MVANEQLAPRLYLKIDGRDVDESFSDAIISVEVDNSLTLPDMVAIHLRDPNLQWIDDNSYAPGKSVEISSRPASGSEVNILTGEITAVEPRFNRDLSATLVLRGYDKGHRLHRGRKTRTFQNSSDSDIASQVARDYSLSPQVDSTSPVHDYVVQDNKTDWEFLVARARRNGLFLTVRGDDLHFARTPNPSGQTPTLEWAGELLEFNARLTTAHQVSEVVVQGWDPAQQQQIVGRATTPNDTPQIGESQQGGQAAQQAFGGSASEIVVDHPVTSQAEADAVAQAICDELGQGFIQADCVCVGNPEIQAGANVRLDGLGTRFSGTYRVTHAVHRRDIAGYKTEFTVGGRYTSTIGELLTNSAGTGRGLGPALGVVTNNDDPDALGRVRVRIPALADQAETFWARLVATGAGPERGIQWVPEVNDEVLVVFEHDDTHRPLVVGGLWSSQNAIPNNAAVANGAVNERIIKSRSGHLIIMGDESGSEKITIKDMTGNNQIIIDSASNSITVNADQDVTIEAQGKITVKSTGNDLAFEGMNCEIKANQNFSVQANGTCEIKSISSCTVEGTAGLTLKNAAAQIAMSGPTINMNNGALEVM